MRCAANIISAAPMTPGIMPATNNSTTEAPAITAYRIMGIDGGIITARVEADEVTAAAKSAEYPERFIAGMRIDPKAATSATADPEISAKKSDAPMVTIDKPPRTKPISAEVNAISRREMPVAFITAPARMNNGMAISENFVAPSCSVSGMFGRSRRPVSKIIAPTAVKPNAIAMGTSIRIRATRPRTIAASVMSARPAPRGAAGEAPPARTKPPRRGSPNTRPAPAATAS